MRMQNFARLLQFRRFAAHEAKDDLISLRIRQYLPMAADLDFADCLILDIIDRQSGNTAGEISLRIGESESLYYLGHIGYHVDPPYRGSHYALRACRLCLPLLREIGMRSVVITTDEDNAPSIRTCEELGCCLESTVDVPGWCVEKYQISRRKRIYVLVLT